MPAHITPKAALVTLTPVSQENVRLTPNFNKHLLKIIFSIPAVWDPANLDPAMMKIMGALAAVNQVIFPETPGDGAGQTPALDFRLASRHAGSGGELAVVTAFGKKSEREERIFGWDKKDGEMYYYENDGMIQDEFREIDGKWYYFHEDGHMARDEFVHYRNHTYYLDKKGHKQDDEDIFQRKDNTYYINDFKFTGTGSKRRENEALAEEMMFCHQQYHQCIEDNPYVTQSSILACTKGTKLTRLDARTAVDIRDIVTGLPVLGCDACKADENIYSFYGCRASDTSDMPTRPVIAGGYKKCIPTLGMWTQNHDAPLIWNSVNGDQTVTLIRDSAMVCRFGGMIGVVEIPEAGDQGSGFIITSKMMQDFAWPISDDELKVLNETLKKYGIIEKESILLFMATCAHESEKGGSALEKLMPDGTTIGNYLPTERGAGYIQLTWRSAHLKFLATIPDTFSEIDTATYIAQNYPWQAAAWFWTSVEAKTVSKTEELSINEYIEQYGGSFGVYLIIQYAVNSWSGSPSNDILTDIRDGKTSWDAENGRIFVNGTDVGKTPVGWDDVENNYNRENTYYEAIKCFQ